MINFVIIVVEASSKKTVYSSFMQNFRGKFLYKRSNVLTTNSSKLLIPNTLVFYEIKQMLRFILFFFGCAKMLRFIMFLRVTILTAWKNKLRNTNIYTKMRNIHTNTQNNGNKCGWVYKAKLVLVTFLVSRKIFVCR